MNCLTLKNLLFILPLLISITILTNHYHNILGKFITGNGNIYQDYNWGFYLLSGYIYLFWGAGFFIILKKSLPNKLHFIKYITILATIILIPLIFLLLYYLRIANISISALITFSFYFPPLFSFFSLISVLFMLDHSKIGYLFLKIIKNKTKINFAYVLNHDCFCI